MIAETAEQGIELKPHLVKEVRGVSGYREPRPGRARVPAKSEDWQTVVTALEKVVSEGTGTAARVPGVRVGGKTGTSQNPHGEDHALFVCVAPLDDPTIAIAVVVENAGHGGSEAAPRAGEALRRVFLPDSLRRPAPRPAPTAAPADDRTIVRNEEVGD